MFFQEPKYTYVVRPDDEIGHYDDEIGTKSYVTIFISKSVLFIENQTLSFLLPFLNYLRQ